MRRKTYCALGMLVWLILPVSLLSVGSVIVAQGEPDFSLKISSELMGNHTFTKQEFMALPNVTGWANGGDYGQGKYQGVNVTWLLVTYGDYGANLSYKFIASDGFTVTKTADQILSNATHCHILAYHFEEAFLPDDNHHLQLLPVTTVPGQTITFPGNQNPWGIAFLEVIGASEQATSEANIHLFVILFSSMFGVVSIVIIVVMKYRSGKAEI